MAGKARTRYECLACGADYPRWVGACSRCGAGPDSIKEVPVVPASQSTVLARQGYGGASRDSAEPRLLSQVAQSGEGKLARFTTSMSEFDRVLGGGMVVGGSVVMGGNPGAGKSTLLLQTACYVSQERPTLYNSAEENLDQILDRAQRLSLPTDKLKVMAETNVVALGEAMIRELPSLFIVDSIQAVYHPEIGSPAGTPNQVKGSAVYLNQVAKDNGVSLVLVGHVVKSEGLAGPMSLQHVVDINLMLSSSDDARYRMLRAEKNRFGSTFEVGVFAMTDAGLQVVGNPSSIFLSRTIQDATGSVATSLWEGTRPLLVEIQALLDANPSGNPRRVAVGMDDKRVAMLIAILNKHGGGMQVAGNDVYVNVVGGIRVTETSADLPVLLAAASSFRDKVIPTDVICFGEVGLSGEIRPCPNGADRIREAAKLGFRRAVVPLGNCDKEGFPGLELVPVSTLAQAVAWMENL